MQTCKTTLFVIVLLAAFFGTCCARTKAGTEPVVVCLDLPDDTTNFQAQNAIEWWREPVVFRCPGQVVVEVGQALPNRPFACGYTDGTRIVWVCGPIWTVVRHEFGHVLGYPDVCGGSGIMASGDDCPPPGGTW